MSADVLSGKEHEIALKAALNFLDEKESERLIAAKSNIHKMTCCNCHANDWSNVDQYRLKPSGMHICKSCGFASYPSKWATYEEIKKHYQSTYRKPPTSANLFTGQRKLHFHNKFLAPLFKEWKEKNFDSPNIFEIGAAYGLVLDWLKQLYPKSNIAGTELTTSYKRVCKHEFGIDLVDDFDDTKKYDLIVSYKVAEHQLDVDKELRKYATSLTDDGRLYISIPTWFDSANNFGIAGFDLEYYYDPNHINMWTRPMFENMLARAGLEVVQKDYLIYDSTYLCKRNDNLLTTAIYKENVPDIIDRMDRIKKAFMLFTENKYEEAIAVYPDYPHAHTARSEMIRKESFAKGWDWIKANIIEFGIKSCPTSVEFITTCTDLAMRAEKWDEAIRLAELSLKLKPENPVGLSQLINIMREMALRSGDEKTKIHYFKQARDIARHLKEVSSQHFREAVDMIYTFDAQLPLE